MNLSLWILYSGDHTVAKLGAYYATSLPFDIAHVVGNVAFCLAFGPALVAALTRYRSRFTVTWRPALAAALAAAFVLTAPGTQPAQAAAPQKSVDYLVRAQNDDGGFPPAPGASSTQLHTAWAALGLAANGRAPEGTLRYMRANAAKLRGDVGELTRTMLALGALGESARDFAGRDLVEELLARRRDDGSWSGRVNTTAFAILGLRAAGFGAGHRVVRRAAGWLVRRQNDDGGFSFSGQGASGIDETGAVLQALVASGRKGAKPVKRGVRWLLRRQNPDGGYPLMPGGASNAQSTAWAVQGLVAAGRNPAKVRRDGSRSPIAYLERLVGSDGAIRYSRSSTQTPVWVTAQALAALARKAFPLRAVARRARAAAPAPAPEPTAAPTATAAPGSRHKPRPQVTPEPAPDLSEPAFTAGFVTGLALSAVV